MLRSWRRAAFIGALLVGLYAVLYILLSLEAYSLLIGSLMLFAALAGVMYATRRIDWGARRGKRRTRDAAKFALVGGMSQAVPPKRIFPTSKVDARAAEHVPSIPQTESEAYKLAFQDTEFLLREDLRPVRFQLELLKPELLLNEANIGSTFVFYGSARIPAPDKADALIAAATNDEQRAVAERLKAKSKYYDVARELARLASRCGRDEDGKQPFRRLLGRRPVDHGSRQPRRARRRADDRSGSTSCFRTSNCPTAT